MNKSKSKAPPVTRRDRWAIRKFKTASKAVPPAALHFVDGIEGALSNSLGDEAGQAKLNEMLNAAANLFNTDMVWGAMNDISQGVTQNAADSTGIMAPNFSPMLQEEEHRQCGLGNRAACN